MISGTVFLQVTSEETFFSAGAPDKTLVIQLIEYSDAVNRVVGYSNAPLAAEGLGATHANTPICSGEWPDFAGCSS